MSVPVSVSVSICLKYAWAIGRCISLGLYGLPNGIRRCMCARARVCVCVCVCARVCVCCDGPMRLFLWSVQIYA